MSAMDMLKTVTLLILMININCCAAVNIIHMEQTVKCAVQALSKNAGDSPNIMNCFNVNLVTVLGILINVFMMLE